MNNEQNAPAPRCTEQQLVGRVPSPDEAHACLVRLINSHFRRYDRECGRFSIPARPDHDDDLLLGTFIEAYGNAVRKASAALEPLELSAIATGTCDRHDVANRISEARVALDTANKTGTGPGLAARPGYGGTNGSEV